MFDVIKAVAIFAVKKAAKIDPACPFTQDNLSTIVDIAKALIHPF